MSQFVENPGHFAAECVRQKGRCAVRRENILFLDHGQELAAIGQVQTKCGNVVIIPDTAEKGQALLYHTSCDRMTDVIKQIFRDSLEEPSSLPQAYPEMTVGTLQRRRIKLSYDACRSKVDAFDL